jgi:hypothetical protein
MGLAENGTRHGPDIQPQDVEELFGHGAAVIVLSRGMQLQLPVDRRTLAYLDDRGVVAFVAETTEAVGYTTSLR